MAKLVSSLGTLVPIIKVVGDFCNLRCNYCFYNNNDQSLPTIMNGELLEKFITQYMGLFQGQLLFIWHGGEPLLAGLPFFEKVIQLQNSNLKNGQTIKNAIQTNATLIDRKWAEFFKRHNFRVGVSLDGDKNSHNRYRKDFLGNGSFSRTVKGIGILAEFGIKPGVIQTLTKNNLERLKEDFDFFSNIIGIKNLGINPYLDATKSNKIMLKQTISNEELTAFLKKYVAFWLEKDDAHFQIREIDNFIAGIFEKRASSCTFNGSCTKFFCLNYDGEIYPCDRFCHQSELLFGDISNQTLSEVLRSTARQKYIENVNHLPPDCLICDWQKACHNGCTHHRINKISGKYFFCATRKAIFSYLKERMAERKNNLPTKSPGGRKEVPNHGWKQCN